MRRAGYAGLRRNVAIALGNWLAASDTPDPEAVGQLVSALSDEDATVAEAAAWALGRVGEGPAASRHSLVGCGRARAGRHERRRDARR